VGGIDKHFLSHISLVHNLNRARPGGRARLGWCLVRAISDAARQGRADGPPAKMLNACAGVIAVHLRQTRTIVGLPILSPARVCLNRGTSLIPLGIASVCPVLRERYQASPETAKLSTETIPPNSGTSIRHNKSSEAEMTMGILQIAQIIIHKLKINCLPLSGFPVFLSR
jgi:hypothetical protein